MQFVRLLALAIVVASCAKPADSTPDTPSINLVGTWWSECLNTGAATSERTSLTYTNDTEFRQKITYNVVGCKEVANPISRNTLQTITNTIKLGSVVALNNLAAKDVVDYGRIHINGNQLGQTVSSATEIDFQKNSVTVLPYTNNAAGQLSAQYQMNSTGTSFNPGQITEVTNYALDIPEAAFDLYVVDGNILYFGDKTADRNATTQDMRPTALNFNLFYLKN